MENACFRCKTPIEDGATFCRECGREVSLGDGSVTHESRRWLLVALYPAWLVAAAVLVPAVGFVLPRVGGLLAGVASLASLFGLFVFMWALVADAAHVRRRDDGEWAPSEWGYYGLAALCFVGMGFPVPFVAAYHLYRRRTAVGLPT